MKRTWPLIVVFLAAAVQPAQAGGAGTQSPFSLGTGARDLALGASRLTDPDPVTAVYWNPSALARVERISLGGFHSRLFESGTAYQYIGTAVPTMDFGSFGFGLFRLGVEGIEERDADNVLRGEFDESRMAMYFGYGRTLSDYDVGLALSLEHHSLAGYSGTSSPGLSLSIRRGFKVSSVKVSGIDAGLAARNILRPRIKLDSDPVKLPSQVDASVSVGFLPNPDWRHELRASVGVSKVEGLDPGLTAGIEYGVEDLLHLRGGLRDGDACFGAGVSYRSINFDYAHVSRDLGSLHMFSISTALGMPVSTKREVREARREAQFNQLIGRSLTQRNLEMVSGLVASGKRLMEQHSIEEAAAAFDRAMFLASGSGLDTTDVYRSAERANREAQETLRMRKFEADMDSAWSKLSAGEYLDARFFALRALNGYPDSKSAADVLERIDAEIDLTAANDIEVRDRILRADSLTSYGKYEDALAVAMTLREIAPYDERVSMTIRKAEFGLWREAAEAALARSDHEGAQAAADSALVRFPEHPWGAALGKRIQEEKDRSVVAVIEEEAAPPPLSVELRKEVEEAYTAGQDLFEEGRLAEAVARWEKVETLAPGHKSVREYLVEAYKFLGVELYTQNHLERAVEVWKKAARLEPGSEELSSYIKRTEAEISRLQEISYDFQ
jgi:tetratricopeptide (TPR) repeat protein